MTNTNSTARTNRLETLTAIGRQILSMLDTGAVDMDRALYCTAGKFSETDVRDSMKMLHAAGLADYRGGKYYAAAV